MSATEVVPWFCREEWEFCRNNLFGSDVTMKKKAVEHLYIWKTRCSNLHMGVECTLVLMDTNLQDLNEDGNENRLLNRMNLELMYSMALTKFVNFVTDSSVGNRTAYMLQDLAKELGIPSWIVDLRHKAAHGSSCPSLPLLREAADFCLKWLYNEYWANGDFEDICNQSENSVNDVESCLDIHLMIKNYLMDGCEQISDISSENKQKIRRFLHKASKTTEDDYFDDWNLNNVCKITVEKLSKLIKKYSRKSECLIDKLLAENQLLSSKNINGTGRLEESYVYTWNEILSVICVSNKCYYFLRALAKITIDPMESMIRQKCAAIHLNEIFINILKQNPATKSKSHEYQNTLKLRRPLLLDQEAALLLKLVLQHPSDFVVIYLKSLLEVQSSTLNSSKTDTLIQLMNIYNGHSELVEMNINNDIKHLLDSLLPHDEEKEENNYPSDLINKEDIADKEKQHSESWNWSLTPIGILPWQQDFKPWLKLYGV